MNGSKARRAFVAVALLVGCYVLALGIAGTLLALAVLQWLTPVHNLWLTVTFVVVGFTILSAIVPRRMPFETLGPVLDRDSQPELHALVDEVAAATEQERPAEVYLAHDVNAAVAHVGGVLGFGGRRVLIVGLPLMHCLTVPQLRAVLAHEFGHYHGGDTRLGPFFARTYDAVSRTVSRLHDDESWWHKPFEWYGLFFLRRSAKMRREQEFDADAIAAEVAGRDNAKSVLRAVHAQGASFAAYWDTEYEPALASGVRAPFTEGFERFGTADRVSRMVKKSLEADMNGVSEPYDSHPTLGERLAALERLPDTPGPGGDERPSICLLRDSGELERAAIDHLLRPDARGKMQSVEWDDLPEQVMIPGWRSRTEEALRSLREFTVGGAARAYEAKGVELAQLVVPKEHWPTDLRYMKPAGADVVAAAVAVALVDAGWTVTAPPGEPIALEHGGERLEPWTELSADEVDQAAWYQRCTELGIDELPLGSPSPAAAPAPVAAA